MEVKIKEIDALYRVVISKSDAIEYFGKCSGASAFDYETGGKEKGDGLLWERGHIIGTSFSYSKKEAVYLPWRHRTGNAESGAIEVMAEFMRDTPLIAHNMPFEWGWTKCHLGFELNIEADTQAIIGVYNSNLPRSLKDFVKHQYKHSMQTFKEVTGGTEDFKSVTVEKGYPYGCSDSLWTYRIYKDLLEEINTDVGLKAIYGLESKTIPLICNMHYDGIKVDTELLQQYLIQIQKNIDEATEAIMDTIKKECPSMPVETDIFGNSSVNINLNSSQQLIKVFGLIGFDLKESGTGVEVLTKIAHPLAQQIVKYRKEVKLQNTFLEPYVGFTRDSPIIHPGIKSIIKTGRMASSAPNLMAVPKVRD